MDILPAEDMESSDKQEDSETTGSSMLLPVQCQLRDAWSTINAQVMMTAEGLEEQASQPWTTNQELERAASMRIFTSIMLHAWRQRRADVRRLQKVVERLQRKSMNSRNELHVSNTLMRVEQKRCMELQLELKKSVLSINEVRSSCEKLTASVNNLEADKMQLQQELDSRKMENKELEMRIGQCKEDLLKALMEQRSLQLQLTGEQASIQQLKLDNEKMINEVRLVQNMELEVRRREGEYIIELDEKKRMLSNMRNEIESLEHELRDRIIKYNELKALLRNFEHGDSALLTIDEGKQPIENSSRRSRFHYIPFRKICLQGGSNAYRFGNFLSAFFNYTTSAISILWVLALPNNSLRYGCM